MVKVGRSRFGGIGNQVARASFLSGKVDADAIIDPFIDLNYMVHMFQYDSSMTLPMAGLIVHSRLRTGSLSSKGRP